MDSAEEYLLRWQRANLLDESKVAEIRAYEAAHARHGGRQWQVMLVLTLGGILLGAGVLLFVAAHWESVSPVGRLLLVLAMLSFFHLFGLFARERFPGLATAMHAVGTASAGAAIALVGQIFNMQEHWPSAILLWALCAAAGWFLLRDQFQQTLTLLLVPAWIVCEWGERTSHYDGSEVYIARICLVLGIVYLTAFLHSRKQAVFGILFGVGALVVPICIAALAVGWLWPHYNRPIGFVPLSWRLAALLIVLLSIGFGAIVNRRSIVPACVALSVAYILPWIQRGGFGPSDGYAWNQTGPGVVSYGIIAAAAVFLVWWGVHTSAKALVNYGMVAFALTVIWFYFSNVMDKLDRSFGLIMLGVLFLAGGWLLERTRRRLIGSITEGAA